MKKIGIAVILAAIFLFWQIHSVGSIVLKGQQVTIEQGQTASSLPTTLGISPNSMFYKMYLKLYAPDFSLQVGSYTIPENTTLAQALQTYLTKPQAKEVSITILPGWNIYDIDAYLAQKGLIQAGELTEQDESLLVSFSASYSWLDGRKTLEAFLYPDTYRINPSASLKDIIGTLLKEFDKKIVASYGLSGKELYDTLILASLVEREEKNSTNKPVVAGIMKNRLKTNMALGIDATACYAYQLTQQECTPKFINAHIFDKNKYNLRKTTGLTPSPISSVSADTFSATVNAQDTPYYYYLHDSEGDIHYATTLQEHAANRVKYLGK